MAAMRQTVRTGGDRAHEAEREAESEAERARGVEEERKAPREAGSRSRFVREAIRFGAVGGAGVLVNLVVFNLVEHTTALPVVRASVIATVVSIVFNYVGFRYYTYRGCERAARSREITLFLVFSAIGLVIENGVLYGATYGLGWDSSLQSNAFKILGIGIATLFRFWSYRTWVFALPTRDQPGRDQSGAPSGRG